MGMSKAKQKKKRRRKTASLKARNTDSVDYGVVLTDFIVA
jgi:hypothetical protein